ncbi:multidrug effflux MFS transporter [Moritella marina ATCC 15381]|uniref:Bcr/CflA family efflux transporter n=1 Tax=Moritella marina ATCC 15381 TaxID=1202962 RepID=A0A5J6WGZ5_MORMI|nr:multidrug effflux MFS transporter [Moritella marina]QFI37349.1 multidrug effflux MFS transporter [Moritella marina ATCC 15381]
MTQQNTPSIDMNAVMSDSKIETNKDTAGKMSKTLILTLAAVFALTPFTIDSYLPAMPTMAKAMDVDISLMSVTVSLYIFGLAIGQLIGGPLSDKKGRSYAMIAGLVVFALASLLLTTATQIEVLWFWRVIQAVGGGMAVVGVPATIRDTCSGKEAAKLFSLIALIMMIAPSIAPTVGTIIMSLADWRWIFYTLAIMAVLVAILVMRFMPKTKKVAVVLSKELADKKPDEVQDKIGLLSVFSEKRALGFMIAQAFAYSVMMIFLTNASMMYMEVFGQTPQQFSLLFFANICGLIVVNRANSFLLARFEPESLLKAFLSLQVLGGIILVMASVIVPDALYVTVAGFVIAISANGAVISNASACFMKRFGRNAGSASAVLGATQYTVGGTVSALSAFISMGSVQPVVVIMLISSITALTGATIAGRYSRSTQA